ncbi:MAG: DegT/DnrJ/EryC1/StrS family aminotransferase [Dehalococcoidales bacterium]|nr:DegT/DnrJ/EryC1/StrS family aminotransferase [Dehalococcoidales bacterium]
MKIPVLRLEYSEEEIRAIQAGIKDVLKSGYLTMGTKVAEFEKAFATFTGARYAVATNSGTSSLEIILRAIGVDGRTVVVPSNTMMASPVAVVHAGGKVIFADCDKENLQLDPKDLKKKLRADTRAVMLVHIGGIISPSFQEIKEICDKNRIILIEDAAHAHGATIGGKQAGTLGLAGSFSFYPTKPLVTAEGGMVTTEDEGIYRKAVSLRDHGRAPDDPNNHVELGYNWRFSELHAVLGIQQMKKAKAILTERRKIAAWYDKKLDGVKGIRKLYLPAKVKPSYYKYIVFLDDNIDREMIKKILKEKYSVSLTSEVYSHPCHKQPAFKKYPGTVANDPADTFPQTEYVAAKHICLPVYPGLTEPEVDYVVDSLKKVLSE